MKFIPEEGTHILFNHILELFRSGLIQVFFLLASIWVYIFAVMGMYVLGNQVRDVFLDDQHNE